MIQRIQSIYLLIISLISILSYLIFPKLNYTFSGLSFTNYLVVPYLCLSFFVSFFNIFLFKNRGLQLNINKIHLLIHLLVLIIFSFIIYQKKINYSDIQWIITPISSVFFFFGKQGNKE